MYIRNLRKILSVCLLAAGLGVSAQKVYNIYPIPQEQVRTEGSCRFTPTVTVIAEKGIDEPTKARAAEVLRGHGLKAVFAKKATKGSAAIFLGVNGSKGAADKLAKKLALKRDIFGNKKFDRHILSLTANGGLANLVVLGENTNAVFFGLASLEQMLDNGTGNLPCATIYDYADIKDRGVIEGYYGMPYSVEVTKDLSRNPHRRTKIHGVLHRRQHEGNLQGFCCHKSELYMGNPPGKGFHRQGRQCDRAHNGQV